MAQDTKTLEDLDYATKNLTASDQVPEAPDEKEESHPSHDPSSFYLLPFLILKYLNKAKFLEEDSEYIKISEKIKKDYLKDRALGKKAVGLKEDVLTEEDLEYIYGQETHPGFPSLSKDAEKIFTQGLDEKNVKKRAKLVEKRKKKLEKYEKEKNKIYKNPDQDPAISHLYGIIETHASLKYLFLTKIKKQKNIEYSKIRDEIKTKAWIGFIHRYPKKAIEYRNRKYAKAKCYKDLIQAYIQTWNTSQQSSLVNSNVANRQADEIVKKELEKQKEEQTSTAPQQTRDTKLSTKTVDRINRFASRLMRQPSVPVNDALPQSAPESPSMEPPNPPQRPSGLSNRAINGANRLARTGNPLNKLGKKFGGSLLKQGAMAGARAGAFFFSWWILVGIGIGVFISIVVIIISIFISPSPEAPPSTGGGDIASCTFYRGGDLVQGTKFGNPQMAAKISEISGKAGVPAAIVAGIMRVETAQAITSKDPTYLKNDYDAHYSGAGAVGVMQFMPPTFLGIYNIYQDDLRSKFNKISAKMTIDLQSNMEPKNVFRIYSIEDSITAAAYKVKNDKRLINGDGPWNEDTIKEIARRYYGCRRYGTGGCTSGPFDYGEDLWKSFTNCNPAAITPYPGSEAFSCPLKGSRTIGCGSFMSASKYNRGVCSGHQPIDRGHCGRNYGSCFKGDMISTTSQRRAHAIDVDGLVGEKVYLPTIEGLIVEWKYQPQASYPVAPKDGGGYGHVFTANVNGNNWELHLIHTSPPPLILPHIGSTYKSGDEVTTIANTSYPHVHINIGKNPERNNGGQGWLDPESQLGMCAQ